MAFTTAYVLVDHGRGMYASMVEVSVRVLRRTDPSVPIVLVADEDSRSYLTARRERLLALFNKVIWVPADIPHLTARSFEIKTRVRSLVAGDLAYLDGDTLPIRPFGDVFERSGWDLALVQDRNHHRPIVPTSPTWVEPRLQAIGWAGPLNRFFNAGILYLRDNRAVTDVVAEWQRRRNEGFAAGDYDDQLPLNYVLQNSTARVIELTTEYNAMVAAHPVHARRARVLHFFSCGNAVGDTTILAHLIRHLDSTGDLDWPVLDRAIACDHPWMPPYRARRLWQTGNRVRAIATAVRQRLGLDPQMSTL